MRHVAQCLDVSSPNRNFFQLSVGEERDPLTIGRKKRMSRANGTPQEGGIQLIETTHVQLRRASSRLRDKGEQATVGGKRERGPLIDHERRICPDIAEESRGRNREG